MKDKLYNAAPRGMVCPFIRNLVMFLVECCKCFRFLLTMVFVQNILVLWTRDSKHICKFFPHKVDPCRDSTIQSDKIAEEMYHTVSSVHATYPLLLSFASDCGRSADLCV
eukprot:TRINITY_DN2052_c0_g1_i12.p2 TRINITY_DN2052_c0_g1~~TRINITY_DN2052_c0_g1_i12.p2  ORF type:complete len:110 (+),score=14.05 TRINITY_DN2052_c0_g1_i12:170-499(+)